MLVKDLTAADFALLRCRTIGERKTLLMAMPPLKRAAVIGYCLGQLRANCGPWLTWEYLLDTCLENETV
jgi:hypothetical protein